MVGAQRAGRPRRPTLADVAARAGVSVALVSIVMRDTPGASAESRRRVLKAANELGYRPDSRARLLRGSGQQTDRRHVRRATSLPRRSRQRAVHRGRQRRLRAGAQARSPPAATNAALSRVSCRTAAKHSSCSDPHSPTSYLADLDRVGCRSSSSPAPVRHRALDVVRTADDQRPATRRSATSSRWATAGIAHIDGGRAPGAAERRRGYREALDRHGLADTGTRSWRAGPRRTTGPDRRPRPARVIRRGPTGRHRVQRPLRSPVS